MHKFRFHRIYPLAGCKRPRNISPDAHQDRKKVKKQSKCLQTVERRSDQVYNIAMNAVRQSLHIRKDALRQGRIISASYRV